MQKRRLILFSILFGSLFIATLTTVCSGDEGIMTARRHKMVDNSIAGAGIVQKEVLSAMRTVPRHLFVSPMQRHNAYKNRPLPIDHDQTISQPYIVALMTELLELDSNSVVLEVGTGSGYQAAILSVIADKVYTIEYIEALGLQAKKRLADLGYDNVEVKIGDGYVGWPEHQPFDAIIVTAAPDHIPEPLIEQLKPGGRLVIPVGATSRNQELLLVEKCLEGKLRKRRVIPVRFVPFLGENVK